MSAEAETLAQRYAAALHAAVEDPGEQSLSAAYELGRSAVRSGLSVLDFAAVHTEALATELRTADDAGAIERATQAAGAFFLESVSAYEMLQRVLRESQERVRLEQRQATLLRRLSGFLGDASLAADTSASEGEVLQLVAEHALDFVDAAACRVSLRSATGNASPIEVTASAEPDGAPDPATVAELAEVYDALDSTDAVRLTAAEVGERISGAPVAWLAAALTALDGRRVGVLELYGRPDAAFTDVDEAVVAQLAHLASATIERMELYRR